MTQKKSTLPNSYSRRIDIAKEVNRVFKTEVGIEERCMQVLEDSPLFGQQFVNSLISADPSIYNAVLKVYGNLSEFMRYSFKCSFPHFFNSKELKQAPFQLKNIETLIRKLFQGRKSYHELDMDEYTTHGDIVKMQKKLTCFELFIGLVDDNWFSIREHYRMNYEPGETGGMISVSMMALQGLANVVK